LPISKRSYQIKPHTWFEHSTTRSEGGHKPHDHRYGIPVNYVHIQ